MQSRALDRDSIISETSHLKVESYCVPAPVKVAGCFCRPRRGLASRLMMVPRIIFSVVAGLRYFAQIVRGLRTAGSKA
jgi:hypothetical protein